MKENKDLNKIRRNNAKLYPIYKMFSWDLLFFYSIEFLFYTITKKVTASEVLIINGFYLFFRIVGQIPAVAITDFLGRKKGIVVGDILVCIYLLVLIIFPGVISIIVADLIFALGYDIKTIAESNLLYDSVATKGGEGLYSKIDAKGRKFVLYIRWNCIICCRIFICNEQLFTNIYNFGIFYNCNINGIKI